MTVTNGYQQSDFERPLDILNLPSLEKEAQKIIPAGGFGYITSGAEDEWTLRETPKLLTTCRLSPAL